MFDPNMLLDFLKVEPGHGLVQSVLLFMIWLQSKGLRQEMAALKDVLTRLRHHYDQRFENLESRVEILESNQLTKAHQR